MSKRSIATFAAAVLVALGAGAAAALACGDGTPKNLVASAQVKAGLTAAYLADGGSPSAELVPGHTYYGSYGEVEFAVATFSDRPYPAVLSRMKHHHGGWQLVRRTHGGVCHYLIPPELTQLWAFQAWGKTCFVPPR